MQPALFTHTSHHKCYTTSKSCHALPRPPAQRARAAAASARHGGLNWNGTACRPAPARCPLAARRVTPATSLCSSLLSRRRQRQRGGGCRSPQRQPGGGDLCSTHARKSASGWHVRAWDGGGRDLAVVDRFLVSAVAENEVRVHLHPHSRGRIKKSVGIGPIGPLGSCLLTATLLARA